MSENHTTTDAFLSGEGVPVDLHDIETELIRLWGPAAERAGSPVPEQPTVTRIVLANLVVFGQFADPDRLRAALDTVTTRFPSRTIVVCPKRGSRAGRRGRGLRALPSPRAGAPPGLLRADRAPRRPAGRRPPARGDPPAARGRPAVRALVDRRPPERRGPLPRPGRRVLAADPRPARPGRRARRDPPRTRPDRQPL